MDGLVVATDVISFLFKNHPLARHYLRYLTGITPIVSFMTVAELDAGHCFTGALIPQLERGS